MTAPTVARVIARNSRKRRDELTAPLRSSLNTEEKPACVEPGGKSASVSYDSSQQLDFDLLIFTGLDESLVEEPFCIE